MLPLSFIFVKLQQRKLQTILLIILYTILLFSRLTNLIISGRFCAEEGQIFFYNAWTMTPLQALFNNYGGYLNLPATSSTLLTRWIVPLEYAPYVTTFIGLIFEIFPLFLLITAKDDWLQPFKTRLIITILLVFLPQSLETSLQTLHSQFYLTITSAIILTLTANKYQRYTKILLLILTALSGLMTIVFLPLFFLKSFLEKNYFRYEQLVCLIIGNSLQFIFFYESFKERTYHFSFHGFFDLLFTKDILTIFLGNNEFTKNISHYLISLYPTHQISIIVVAIDLLIIGLLYFCIYKYPKTRNAGYLFTCAFINLAFTIVGAIGSPDVLLTPYIAPRYFIISQTLLYLSLIYLSYLIPNKGKYITRFLILWLLIITPYNYYTDQLIVPLTGIPSWKQQVELWKNDPNYIIKIWPIGQTMQLSPIKNN